MPYLRAFRALCEGCEQAEATVWCVPESRAFCVACDAQIHGATLSTSSAEPPHERVAIAAQSVLSPICDRCKVKLSAAINPARHECICEDCGALSNLERSLSARVLTQCPPSGRPAATPPAQLVPQRDVDLDEASNNVPHAMPLFPLVPLKASKVANSVVFDKMDFSAGVAMRGAKCVRSRRSAKLVLAALGGPETIASRVSRWLHNPECGSECGSQCGSQCGTTAAAATTAAAVAMAAAAATAAAAMPGFPPRRPSDMASEAPMSDRKASSAPTRGLSTNSGTASDRRHSENPPGPDPGGTAVPLSLGNLQIQPRGPASALDLSYFATEVPNDLVAPRPLGRSPNAKRKALGSATGDVSPTTRRRTEYKVESVDGGGFGEL